MYKFEIFNAHKDATNTVQKFELPNYDKMLEAISTWAATKNTSVEEYDYILKFLVWGKKKGKIEINLNGEIVQISCTQRSDIRLAVTLTEVYDADLILQKTIISQSPEEAVRAVRAVLETESKERKNLSFDIDWNDVKKDLAYGNQDDKPYRIEAEWTYTVFYLTSHLFEV